MSGRFFEKQFTSFQIIIVGFLTVILIGALLLSLPVSSAEGLWTSASDALFTSVSTVCVTGLVVKDTAIYWSVFGQAVILILIQIGGLGIISVTAMIAAASGRKISLMQRSMLQESISANHVGGVVKLTGFVCRVALAGAFAISVVEGLPFEPCIFETASAIGTVGLSMGMTPELGLISRFVLTGLMFFGRVGALTFLYAVNSCGYETSQYPIGKINVG